MKMAQCWLFALVVVVAGCMGTSDRLNKVSLGMTRPEVIKAVGKPDSVSAQSNVEYLIYHWGSPKELVGEPRQYFIRLANGEVDAYGEKGDFGTTSLPTQKVSVEVNGGGGSKK